MKQRLGKAMDLLCWCWLNGSRCHAHCSPLLQVCFLGRTLLGGTRPERCVTSEDQERARCTHLHPSLGHQERPVFPQLVTLLPVTISSEVPGNPFWGRPGSAAKLAVWKNNETQCWSHPRLEFFGVFWAPCRMYLDVYLRPNDLWVWCGSPSVEQL